MKRNIAGQTFLELGKRLEVEKLGDLLDILDVDGILISQDKVYDYDYGPIEIVEFEKYGKKYILIKILSHLFPKVKATRFAQGIANKLLKFSSQ